MTSQDIEIAVAKHFDPRQNLIVPNVHWGWGFRHEADMIVLRPSGYCDEIEIKVTAADIKADAKKQTSHWEKRIVLRVWFAVPANLADSEYIPARAGILSVTRRVYAKTDDETWQWREWRRGDAAWQDHVAVVRPAKIRPKDERLKASDKQRIKLAELGCMRIWSLKAALVTGRQRKAET